MHARHTRFLPCAMLAGLALTAQAQTSVDNQQTDGIPEILKGGLAVFPADGEAYVARFDTDGTYRTGGGEAGGWSLQNGYLCLSEQSGAALCTRLGDDAAPGDQWRDTSSGPGGARFALPGAPEIPNAGGG